MKKEIFPTLITPFVNDMDTAMPWCEYPRPSIVRDSFLCLNGAWDFAVSKRGAAPEYKEKILDSLFTTDTFPSPYKKNDFISTCEVNLELIKDSTSLVEDFYKEAKRDLLKISDKSKKVLSKKRK